MFVLYAILAGLVVGLATGGRIEGLASIRFRLGGLALAGLAIQIVLFSGLADGIGEPLGPAIYVGSTALVLVAVLANLSLPGLPLVALGAASNLAAILANGGYMPADPAALRIAGGEPTTGFSNSVVLASPALRPLTDIFAIPEGVPMSNVFSIGDVLIAIGVAAAVAVALHRSPPESSTEHAVRPRTSPD